MKHISDTITKEYLAKLDTMNISISSIIDNFYIGTRKSNKNGISVEFSDFKEYTIGDDMRRADWNSYARTERLYIKRFKEEKQASINIFLDASKSMDYGNENKGYCAKLMAASIAYIALKNSDTVSIYICNELLKLNKIDIKSKNLFLNLISFLDSIKFDGKTNLSKTISELSAVKFKNGISFILSDFFSQDDYKDSIKSLKYKKQEIILIHILSPQEISPQDEGTIKFIDSETEEFREVTVNEHILKEYRTVLKEFQNEIREFCLDLGAGYKQISTNSSIIEAFNIYKNLGT